MTDISAERTLGHSPKVVWPAFAVAGVGAILVAVGEIFDKARLRAVGLGTLCSSIVTVAVGYVAPPGAVVPPDHDVEDIHEHDEPPRRVAQMPDPLRATAPADTPRP